MKFSKRICTFAITALLLITSLPVSASAAGGRMATGVATVTAGVLRLRTGASTSTATLAFAQQGEVVVLHGSSGTWLQVQYNQQLGYMHANYLRSYNTRNVELGYGHVNGTVVNLRSGPGIDHPVMRQARLGDLAYVIGYDQQWYKVLIDNEICYIRSDYLDLFEIPYENEASEKSPLFFKDGISTGLKPLGETLKASANYIASNVAANTLRSRIVAKAKQYIGVPYVWAGSTPKGFDCSGYTQYVLRACGVRVDRTCAGQYLYGKSIAKKDLQPGDLVFFQNTYKQGISHVGIYVGDGNFIHASSSKGVTISSLSNAYWASHYYGARSIA